MIQQAVIVRCLDLFAILNKILIVAEIIMELKILDKDEVSSICFVQIFICNVFIQRKLLQT